MLHLPVSQSCNIDPHSSHYKAVVDIGDEHHRQFSQTQSNKVNSHHHKTAVCPERHIIPNDTTKWTMFVDRNRRGGERKSLSYIFLIPSFSMWPFFVWVWLCGVMINTARHGKRLTVTMEGVVLVYRTTDWPAAASQAHLAGPWEPAAGIREGKKEGYLIILICGITQKRLAMGKQINLATLLNQARCKVLNGVRRGSHEKALECVQGTFELCVRLKK